MKFEARSRQKLSAALAGFGVRRSEICRLLRKREVKVNGIRTSEDTELLPGDRVEAYCRLPADIVYEDGNLLIADKYAGAECAGAGSLEELLSEDRPGLRACHRLDRNTEGLVIYAKSDAAEREIVSLLASHAIRKFYECVAVSERDPGTGRAEAFLFKDAKRGKVFVSDRPGKGTKPIVTEWRQTERIGPDLVRLEVRILTGRTHQIRAHLAHLGFPVLGDGKYGDFAANRKYGRYRQCLVASRIEFPECAGQLAPLSGRTFRSGRRAL